MALTSTEKKDLIQEVVNELTTMSTSIDELAEVTNLSQTESLPAYEKGTSRLVKVPIPLISKPAIDAADVANRAASSATSAASEALNAKNEAVEAKRATEEATEKAKKATEEVNDAKELLDDIKIKADNANTLSNNTSEKVRKQIGDYIIQVPTEAEYEELENKDENTLYFCTENEEL